MSINWQEILFNFLGGLGLFLYSIKTMGEGLQQAAGDRLRYYIDKYTSNPFLGVLVGIVVTALIQSSTGVTVITTCRGMERQVFLSPFRSSKSKRRKKPGSA